MAEWQSAPYSAVCRIASRKGVAAGWFAAPDIVVTAGHVLSEFDSELIQIETPFGPVDCGQRHFDSYKQNPNPGEASDWGFIEIPGGQPAGCSCLKMCVPDPNYRGSCSVVAFDYSQPSRPVVTSDGEIALVSSVRLLHTAQTSESYSGAPILIAAHPVGIVAIGIHTDGNKDGTALSSDPPGLTLQTNRVYRIATSLIQNIINQL